MASNKVTRHGGHPKKSLKWMHFATKDAPELSDPHFLPVLVVNTTMTYLTRDIDSICTRIALA